MRPSRRGDGAALDHAQARTPGASVARRASSQIVSNRMATLMPSLNGLPISGRIHMFGRTCHSAYAIECRGADAGRTDAQMCSAISSSIMRLLPSRLGPRRPHRRSPTASSPRLRRRRTARRRGTHRRHCGAGPAQSALPCVPARHGRAGRAARPDHRQLLDLARGHVPLPAAPHARRRRGDRSLRLHGDAGGRLHHGRRVPLSAP